MALYKALQGHIMAICQFLICFFINKLTGMGQDSQILWIPGGRGERGRNRAWKRLFKVFWKAWGSLKAQGFSERLRPFCKIAKEFEIVGPTHFGPLNKWETAIWVILLCFFIMLLSSCRIWAAVIYTRLSLAPGSLHAAAKSILNHLAWTADVLVKRETVGVNYEPWAIISSLSHRLSSTMNLEPSYLYLHWAIE